MKKLLIAVIALMTLGLQANAQGENWKSNDITVGWGYFSVPQIVCGSAALSAKVFNQVKGADVKINNVDMKSTGAINLEYNRRFTKVFSFGIAGVFENSSIMMDGKATAAGQVADASADIHLSTLGAMLNFRFFWFNKPHVSMYSKLAGGVAFLLNPSATSKNADLQKELNTSLSGVSVLPCLQLSLVGIDFGGETVRGFAELGAGFQGCGLLGVRFRF